MSLGWIWILLALLIALIGGAATSSWTPVVIGMVMIGLYFVLVRLKQQQPEPVRIRHEPPTFKEFVDMLLTKRCTSVVATVRVHNSVPMVEFVARTFTDEDVYYFEHRPSPDRDELITFADDCIRTIKKRLPTLGTEIRYEDRGMLTRVAEKDIRRIRGELPVALD